MYKSCIQCAELRKDYFCPPFRFSIEQERDVQQERGGTSLKYFKVSFNHIQQFSRSFSGYLGLSLSILDYLGLRPGKSCKRLRTFFWKSRYFEDISSQISGTFG